MNHKFLTDLNQAGFANLEASRHRFDQNASCHRTNGEPNPLVVAANDDGGLDL